MDKPTVFISYSHKDEKWKNALRPHLKALEQAGQITIWDDRHIDAGSEWYDRIKEVMDRAAVVMCLISADYLASDFCIKEEIPYLLERRKRDGMAFIPVLIRPCPWFAHGWLEEKQMLPRDGKSIAEDFQGREDGVFVEVARSIFKIVTDPNYQLPAPPPPRWSPPDKLDLIRVPSTGSDLFGRQKELELLDAAWESASTNVISFVAWGGVGKSTLVNKWLDGLKKDNYRGARRVYAWSFYSQGTSERATSADLFINAALIWFGDANPTAGSPWDKGQRLADLMRREKTLLLLDGMEPLQSSLAYERGKIKDPALATLVTELARENPGLCVITTRETVSELNEFADQIQQINLEMLSPEAGRALLRVGGVRGTDEELKKATEDFGRHALALNLLAVYLQDIPSHHISEAAKIPDLDLPAEEGKYPRRLIAALEQKFGEGPEANVLRLLGLFDRPADGASIIALREAPAIPGLTDHIQASSEAGWLRALQRLRKYRLIAEESHHAPDELDAHPLVREHLRRELKREHPDAWREGNNRLYEYLKRVAKEFPNTLEEMSPLCAAIAHCCEAGRYLEALNVYQKRVLMGNEFVNTDKLGAYSEGLSVLSCFFDLTSEQPVACLTDDAKAFLLHELGIHQEALGYLEKGLKALSASLKSRIAQSSWEEASEGARRISELYMIYGDLMKAKRYGQMGVMLANRSGNPLYKMRTGATLAHVLHNRGTLSEAEALFVNTEAVQKSREPSFPLLYSYWGFQYCDLLLDQERYVEVQNRTNLTLKWTKQNDPALLAIALQHLALGRALFLMAQREGKSEFTQSSDYLNLALNDMRHAGQQYHLPRGLIACAELHRIMGKFNSTLSDQNTCVRSCG